MGSPVPTQPETGAICATCNGTLWPTDLTPKFVLAVVSGIQACGHAPDPAPQGQYVLQQDPVNPCLWAAVYGLYNFAYDIQAVVEAMTIKDSATSTQFWFGDTLAICAAPLFTNNWVTCNPGFNYGRFGTVVIHFSW